MRCVREERIVNLSDLKGTTSALPTLAASFVVLKYTHTRVVNSCMQTKNSKNSKNFLNCSPLLYISPPSLLSLSLSFARRLVVEVPSLSLSVEKSVSFLSDDVAFVVVFVLLLFQPFFRFIF